MCVQVFVWTKIVNSFASSQPNWLQIVQVQPRLVTGDLDWNIYLVHPQNCEEW